MIRLLHWILDLLRDPGPFIQWAGYPGMAIVILLSMLARKRRL